MTGRFNVLCMAGCWSYVNNAFEAEIPFCECERQTQNQCFNRQKYFLD